MDAGSGTPCSATGGQTLKAPFLLLILLSAAACGDGWGADVDPTELARVGAVIASPSAATEPPSVCFDMSPTDLRFGATLVGGAAQLNADVTLCGDEPLWLYELTVSADSSPAFVPVPLLRPTELVRAGQSLALLVDFQPETPGAHVGILRLRTSEGFFELPLHGQAGSAACVQTPTITVAEGHTVMPQTQLSLSASSPGMSSWRWSVKQPPGSQSVLEPVGEGASVTLEANVVGEYTFQLRAFDSKGKPACGVAEAQVTVDPGPGLHVELTWSTPGDPDETDVNGDTDGLAGSDLDLHVRHPDGLSFDGNADGTGDGCFHPERDAYWLNRAPNWGDANGPGPLFERDDTDGAGPENFRWSTPEDGRTYHVAAHYWSDAGFGESFATVRVFIDGEVVFESPPTRLQAEDLWEVCSIDWPSGEVRSAAWPSGDPRILPGFVPAL